MEQNHIQMQAARREQTELPLRSAFAALPPAGAGGIEGSRVPAS
jgi:hypothetical protein